MLIVSSVRQNRPCSLSDEVRLTHASKIGDAVTQESLRELAAEYIDRAKAIEQNALTFQPSAFRSSP
jgi:hypothetical protein